MELRSFISFGDELQKIAVKKITLSIPTTKEEASRSYKRMRDPAASALVGAGVGGFGVRALAGGAQRPWLTWRIPALAGAGVGLADYYAMRPARRAGSRPMAGARRKKKTKAKTAMLGSETFTPARSLQQSRAVGGFQDKIIHKGERLRPPTAGQQHLAPGAQI